MSQVVLDSSAVLALLHSEPGAEIVLGLAPHAILSSVNAAEVQSQLLRKGADAKKAWESILTSVQTIVPFDARLAEAAGSLIVKTQSCGLSLGDRACLALALAMNAPVYTTDKAWSKLQLGITVHQVR